MIGDEEGAICGRDDCDGVMEINVAGCRCFIYAPCSPCMDALQCTKCGTRSGPDGDRPANYYDD